MVQSAWGAQETQYFYGLTPERVLDAVEKSLGLRCTGRTMAHASMENRVYEMELDLDEAPRRGSLAHLVIAKFYRPGRWTREQILEEHKFLLQLQDVEIPVVAPRVLVDGETLHKLPDCEIYYAIFPKVGGRSPQELTTGDVEQIGRLLGRMHNVGAQMKTQERIQISPEVFLNKNYQYLAGEHLIPETLRSQFTDLVHRIAEHAKTQFQQSDVIQIHGDCHLGNLLQHGSHFFWVDFDDSMRGPAVQDVWLLLPGRDRHAQQLLSSLLMAYEQMRPFPWESLRLIETLRAMRMVHFAAWIAHRRDDPAFQNAFPDFGNDRYWHQLYRDLLDQEDWMHRPHAWNIHDWNS